LDEPAQAVPLEAALPELNGRVENPQALQSVLTPTDELEAIGSGDAAIAIARILAPPGIGS
jgi:hypothetical protein